MRILLADDAALLREGLAGLLTTAGHEVVAQVADADALRTEVGRLAAAGELPDVVVTDVRMPPTGTDDGLRAAIDLRRAHPGLPVVVLSAYVAGPYVQDLLEETESPTSPAGPGGPSASSGGAVGYLLKERVGRVADFLHSLDIVVGGGVVIDPEVVSHLMKAARAAGSAQDITGSGAGEGAVTMTGSVPGTAPAPSEPQGPVMAGAASPSTPSDGIATAAPGGAGLDRLTRREQEVLELMAQGLSNAQIAERLVVSDGAVAKHVANIFRGLDLQPGEENRRVRAVLAWLHTRA
ncbi:response regulator transcription factor [Actinomyces sp. oral taxon 170]|uniref:response regulator transcription factor n=1 Tax=Actinomyces sp. oral taxon 170 TaxID=712117 RepID=UPI000205D3E4|nr:response regulator transcription factor [Actinomyces sp. oral taxon 170]EGF50264.1 response regulator receiver domain protein [Actinomyces sp. oral taxon 170 str. F0386]